METVVVSVGVRSGMRRCGARSSGSLRVGVVWPPHAGGCVGRGRGTSVRQSSDIQTVVSCGRRPSLVSGEDASRILPSGRSAGVMLKLVMDAQPLERR